MKRISLSAIISCFVLVANAQHYGVGSSTTGLTDIFGNSTTKHRNEYDQSVGSSTTERTDIFGNKTTEHQNTTIWTCGSFL